MKYKRTKEECYSATGQINTLDIIKKEKLSKQVLIKANEYCKNEFNKLLNLENISADDYYYLADYLDVCYVVSQIIETYPNTEKMYWNLDTLVRDHIIDWCEEVLIENKLMEIV